MKDRRRIRTAAAAWVASVLAGLGSPALAAQPAEWMEPVKPFRIATGLYYVGSKGLAAYLIVTDQGAILLDGTMAENAPMIERNIEAVGVPLRSVKLLIEDHAHLDHVGALAQIKHDTGAQMLASAGDVWALQHGEPRGDTHYPLWRFPPVKVDRIIVDGQTIRLGDTVLTAHLTPGHTPGCTSWSMTVRDAGRPRSVLFLCSIQVAGNVLVGNRAYPQIATDYRKTFAKLAGMRADILLTSHPDASGVFEREAAVRAGKTDAFVDPTALPSHVAKAKAAFETLLAGERKQAR